MLGGVFEPVEQPVEKPETPTTPPSTEDLLTIKIEGKIMAVVGTNDWRSIAYGNGKYVAVGLGGYSTTSTDGVNWTTPKQIMSKDIYSIQYGNGVFVTCGGIKIAYSVNGDDWTLITPPNITFGNIYFQDVAYKNGTFVVSFGNKCYSSNDGKTWNDGVSCGLFSMDRLISTSDKFIAFCDKKIATSPDGITWTTSDTSVSTLWHSIAAGNGFIIATSFETVYVSTDGVSYETIKLPKVFGYTCSFSCITFNNGLFIMTERMEGSSWSANKGQYATYAAMSTDGKTWTEWVHVNGENDHELTNRIGAMIVMP